MRAYLPILCGALAVLPQCSDSPPSNGPAPIDAGLGDARQVADGAEGAEGAVEAGSPKGIPTPGGTGYAHTGVTLQSCDSFKNGSGDFVIDGVPAGVVVDGCNFTGGNLVLRPGGPITVRRSLVKSSGCPNPSPEANAGFGIRIVDGAGPIVIEDVEVTSANTSDPSQPCGILERTIVGTQDSGGKNQPIRITRVYAHGARSGMDFTGGSDVLIEDTYHAFNYNPPLPGQTTTCANRVEDRQHASAIRLAGGTSNIRFVNTVLGLAKCGNNSGLIATYPEGGANHGIAVEGGLWILQEEGYGIAAGYTKASEQQNYDFSIKNLLISTEYSPEGCPAGCAQNWNASGSGPIGGLGDPKVWSNVKKYNPGKADDGQILAP